MVVHPSDMMTERPVDWPGSGPVGARPAGNGLIARTSCEGSGCLSHDA